tara:strand:- start:530 stop:691 length:162 start_codon:yes stop_codon:yes gene_type:complete
MSFGGGGESSIGVTNHTHTNLAGEGGNLDDTTLQPDGSTTLSVNIFRNAVMFG